MDATATESAKPKPTPVVEAPKPVFSKPKDEVDIVSFVEEEESKAVEEPKKRESKKADAPQDLGSLLDEWED